MRRLEDLTQDDIDLLGQVWVRVRAAGLMLDTIDYDEFLDAVIARGDHANIADDYLYEEESL